MSLEVHIQQYLDPLRLQIQDLQDRLSKTEATLARVLKSLPESSSVGVEDEVGTEIVTFTAQEGSYAYRPLDVGHEEIRVLALYPAGKENEPLTGELLHVSLNTTLDAPGSRASLVAQSFKTLSYTWGNTQNNEEVIHLEGHKFPVTPNLAAALHAIRREPNREPDAAQPRPTYWWIDAICINQADIQERSQQVNMMTRIYRRAKGVHIWLGDDETSGEQAMDLVRQLGIPPQRGPGTENIVYPTFTASQRLEHWKALTEILRRPWWERVWVRQEVAVARNATVQCGRQTAPFSAFAITVDMLDKMDEQLGVGPVRQEREKAMEASVLHDKDPLALAISPYRRACVLSNFRIDDGRQANVKYRDLTELLLHTRLCKATDMRDKVFSMLGLVDPEFWDIRADYRLSVKETLTSAARRVIQCSRSLDILSGCQNPGRRHGLPSWTPNLVDAWNAHPLPGTRGQPKLGVVPADSAPDFIFEGEGHDAILRVTGRRVDIVARLTDDTPQDHWTDREIDALSLRWREFAQQIKENPKIYVLDQYFARDCLVKDEVWLKFISASTDLAQARPVTAAPISTRGNYQLAQRLLLSQGPESSDGGLPRRIRANLRKFGVGRRLCITEMGQYKGTVAMVSADSQVGDEIWAFRGTQSLYSLRRVEGDKYVVVGDVYGHVYSVLNATDPKTEEATVCII